MGIELTPGIVLLQRRADDAVAVAALEVIAAVPLRRMMTPMGKPMSVETTNCGSLGWVSDADGYRYSAVDPVTSRPWPAMPPILKELATGAAAEAGFPDFAPEGCLINRYGFASRMGLHQDRDERDFGQPIVSVSLGLSALFRIGGLSRRGPTRSLRLDHGDVVVFGGPARLMFHGIDRILPGRHPLLDEARINLTFRRVSEGSSG